MFENNLELLGNKFNLIIIEGKKAIFNYCKTKLLNIEFNYAIFNFKSSELINYSKVLLEKEDALMIGAEMFEFAKKRNYIKIESFSGLEHNHNDGFDTRVRITGKINYYLTENTINSFKEESAKKILKESKAGNINELAKYLKNKQEVKTKNQFTEILSYAKTQYLKNYKKLLDETIDELTK